MKYSAQIEFSSYLSDTWSCTRTPMMNEWRPRKERTKGPDSPEHKIVSGILPNQNLRRNHGSRASSHLGLLHGKMFGLDHQLTSSKLLEEHVRARVTNLDPPASSDMVEKLVDKWNLSSMICVCVLRSQWGLGISICCGLGSSWLTRGSSMCRRSARSCTFFEDTRSRCLAAASV